MPDAVAIWAGMIHQEGKEAALEIAEEAGAEAALDAMEFLRVKHEQQMVRYRDALEEISGQTPASWKDSSDGNERKIYAILDAALTPVVTPFAESESA